MMLTNDELLLAYYKINVSDKFSKKTVTNFCDNFHVSGSSLHVIVSAATLADHVGRVHFVLGSRVPRPAQQHSSIDRRHRSVRLVHRRRSSAVFSLR